MIPQHARKIHPPRALAVPFELGRPLGIPGDAEFQTNVLRAALGLLTVAGDDPVFETWQGEVPQTGTDEDEGWSCPVSFASRDQDDSWRSRVNREMALLRPWYDKSLRERGRTTVGLSKLDVDDLAAFLGQFLDTPGTETQPPGAQLADALKWAAEDLKAFYNEAATAQPGNAGSQDIAHWFWNDCEAGKLLRTIRATCREHPDKQVQIVAGFTLVPQSQLQRT